MKKGMLLLLSLMLAFSMTACANKEENAANPVETGYTAGTYTATAQGMKGEVTVEVTVSESAITEVKVINQQETFGVGYGLPTSPVETLPDAIVAAQSLAVDTVTGATVTSNAILNASKEALLQAGASEEALLKTEEKEAEEDVVLEADVVVVGAGAAGMSAAIEAAGHGAKVIVLEKQGIVGGSTSLSGGKLLAAGTSYQEAQGFSGDTADDLFDYLKSVGGDLIDDEKLHVFTDNALEDVAWLEEMGVDIINVEPIHSSITPWRVMNTQGGGGQISGIGGQISVPLYNTLAATDAEILYNVSANELLMEDGAVVGVKGVRPDGSSVTVNASAVILATGGFAQNREMTAHLGIESYSTTVPAGNVGDGVAMAEAIGAQYYESPGVQAVYVSYTCGVGINEESGLIVSDQGVRVVDEWTYQSHVATALLKEGSQVAWYIASSNDPNPTVQYGISLDSTIKAETVEELAELIDVDPDTLKATIDRYNELCAKGVDEDFGKPAEYMNALEGELYAIKMNPSFTVTFGGLVTDLDAQVLDVNNEVIPGLYAAGEVAFTGLFGDEYPSCGLAIGSAVRFGRIAGENASK